MATHMRATLVVDALKMAIARRRPAPGLIHHSDQGGQYVSLAFGRAARDAGIAVSIGSRGDAYDNAVAETFFATLKKELVNRRSWPSRPELQSAVFEYIEAFHNRERRHPTLGTRSPGRLRTTTTLPAGRLKPIAPTTININKHNLRCHANRGRTSTNVAVLSSREGRSDSSRGSALKRRRRAPAQRSVRAGVWCGGAVSLALGREAVAALCLEDLTALGQPRQRR
jgi:hypothetical protein